MDASRIKPAGMTATDSSIVRRARKADAELLSALGSQTFVDAFAADNTAEDMAAYVAASFSVDQQAAELADPRSVFLIVEIDAKPVGYARLLADKLPIETGGKKPIELVRFYVVRAWHGRGIAQLLMQACLDEARQKGFETLWLGVWERNERARAFYRKCGFQEVGEHAFQLGTDQQNDILMVRSI